MNIQKIYRVRIYYMHTGDDANGINDVINKAIKMSFKEPKVEIEGFDGCAACGPYVQLESESIAAVKRLGEKIERYIKRRNTFELMEN